MIKLEHVVLPSYHQMEFIIEGMRNPLNSWEMSDSGHCMVIHDDCRLYEDCETCAHYEEGFPDTQWCAGKNDYSLMKRLANAGTDHRKFMRMMPVYVRITAPLYWWKEFDTYKVGTVANSCSTMHKITDKEFEPGDFSDDHLDDIWGYEPEVRDMAPTIEFETRPFEDARYVLGPDDILNLTIKMLNRCRDLYERTKEKAYWWQMIMLLPSSYNQTRNVMMNYEVLANIYKSRRNHKLDEWHTFCDWIETLPYSELITSQASNGILRRSGRYPWGCGEPDVSSSEEPKADEK